jgi:hypothetical protein
MYYEYMTTQYFVRFFIPYLLVPPFKNVFQHTFISVNNRGRARSKYVNKLAIKLLEILKRDRTWLKYELHCKVKTPAPLFSK